MNYFLASEQSGLQEHRRRTASLASAVTDPERDLKRSNTDRIQGFVSKTALHPVWVSDVLEMGTKNQVETQPGQPRAGPEYETGCHQICNQQSDQSPFRNRSASSFVCTAVHRDFFAGGRPHGAKAR